ncbi:hypothetical protein Nepgr_014454 [Nepenthes gracilis]|uniref:Uncharacterized protein n=1 Tax=Nepenthes gracilis TaxID=150966 RepID=A0AAD3XPV5_NEPGR|nr:hypothetical protein Nepgr_014454 [Nepenthes gracilis]
MKIILYRHPSRTALEGVACNVALRLRIFLEARSSRLELGVDLLRIASVGMHLRGSVLDVGVLYVAFMRVDVAGYWQITWVILGRGTCELIDEVRCFTVRWYKCGGAT